MLKYNKRLPFEINFLSKGSLAPLKIAPKLAAEKPYATKMMRQLKNSSFSVKMQNFLTAAVIWRKKPRLNK
jgi:hypothetical protein